MLPYWQGEDPADLERLIALWVAGASRLYPTGDEPVCWWLTAQQREGLFNADDEIGDLGGDAG